MFYIKNVPVWERTVRVLLSIAVGVWGYQAFPGALGIGIVVSAVFFSLTGFFGFCPACAMVGRRLGKKE